MSCQYATSFGHLATANDTYSLGNSNSGAILCGILINTKLASAVVTVYNGTSTSGAVIAVIDAATPNGNNFDFHNLRCPAGLFVKLTGGNADVTVCAA